jgi:hypothetical protein
MNKTDILRLQDIKEDQDSGVWLQEQLVPSHSSKNSRVRKTWLQEREEIEHLVSDDASSIPENQIANGDFDDLESF